MILRQPSVVLFSIIMVRMTMAALAVVKAISTAVSSWITVNLRTVEK